MIREGLRSLTNVAETIVSEPELQKQELGVWSKDGKFYTVKIALSEVKRCGVGFWLPNAPRTATVTVILDQMEGERVTHKFDKTSYPDFDAILSAAQTWLQDNDYAVQEAN